MLKRIMLILSLFAVIAGGNHAQAASETVIINVFLERGLRSIFPAGDKVDRLVADEMDKWMVLEDRDGYLADVSFKIEHNRANADVVIDMVRSESKGEKLVQETLKDLSGKKFVYGWWPGKSILQEKSRIYYIQLNLDYEWHTDAGLQQGVHHFLGRLLGAPAGGHLLVADKLTRSQRAALKRHWR